MEPVTLRRLYKRADVLCRRANLPSDAKIDAVGNALLLAVEKGVTDPFTFAFAGMKFTVLKLRDQTRALDRVESRYGQNPDDKPRIYERSEGQAEGFVKAQAARHAAGKIALADKQCVFCGASYKAKGDSATQRFAFKKSQYCGKSCSNKANATRNAAPATGR